MSLTRREALAGVLTAGIASLCLGDRVLAEQRLGWPPVIGSTDLFAADELSGLGLRGFDPVSFFLGTPAPGLAGLEFVRDGVAWRFASGANRDAFERDPDRYVPRIGGFDTTAAAEGRLVIADPLTFAVRNSQLYLFRTERNRARFRDDPAIGEAAEARWPNLKRELVGL